MTAPGAPAPPGRPALVVAIGGSLGAIEALRAVLGPLAPEAVAARSAAALAITVHVAPAGGGLLAGVLQAYTALPVREAVDKAPLVAGEIAVAPPDYHLLVERGLTLALSRDPPEHFTRPAIDPLFESVADAAGPRAIAVLLTGANRDGARGLAAVRAAGGRVAVQDPATARAPEMPVAGLAACAPDVVAGPAALGAWLATVLAAPEAR